MKCTDEAKRSVNIIFRTFIRIPYYIGWIHIYKPDITMWVMTVKLFDSITNIDDIYIFFISNEQNYLN